MYFSLDPSQSGTVNVSFQADIVYTVSSDLSYLQGYAPLDPNSVTFAVEPDCGNGSGEISIGLNQGAEISYFVINTADGSILSSPDLVIPDLAAGDYVVLMQDLLCPTLFQVFFNPPVTVPDGSFTVDVTTINPIVNCTSTNATASGVVSGSVELEVTGGSGSFSSFDDLLVINQGHGPITTFSSLTSSSPYQMTTIDQQTGCEVEYAFTVPSQNDNIDINFDITSLLCTSTPGVPAFTVYSPGIVEAEANGSQLNFNYTWDDLNSTTGSVLVYSELADFTVTAVVPGETCTVSQVFDSSTGVGPPIAGDMNNDGVINGADLSLFLQVFNTFCSVPSSGCLGDFNSDGLVNAVDLSLFLQWFGVDTADGCVIPD